MQSYPGLRLAWFVSEFALPYSAQKGRFGQRKAGKERLPAENFALEPKPSERLKAPVRTERVEPRRAEKEPGPEWVPGLNGVQNNSAARQTEPVQMARVALRMAGKEPGLSAARQTGPERMAQIVKVQQMGLDLKPAVG